MLHSSILRPRRCDICLKFSSTLLPLFQSGSTCGGIHTEKRKDRKSQSTFSHTEELVTNKSQAKECNLLFTAQRLRKTNLADIFSEARSGTIAHKNKKRITAVAHCFPSLRIFFAFNTVLWCRVFVLSKKCFFW
jgi:hypothetical protein